MIDFIGKVYGRLTILEYLGLVNYHHTVLVLCSCGKSEGKPVRLSSLTSGNTKSCGCAKIDAKSTHGLTKHRLYSVWASMVHRCTKESAKHYADYGGRGITVCDTWLKLENFLADMEQTWEPGLTLDRKDNSKGYSAENCKWSSWTEQARNKRNNVNLEFRGRSQCLAAWCAELGLNYQTVRFRLRRGKTIEQALTTRKPK